VRFPLVVGPYTGEMSFEFLTWLPYLRWRFGDDMPNLLAISRGGTDGCYPCPVVNAHNVMSAHEIRNGMAIRKMATGKFKALPDDALDNEILRRLGLQTTIHPSTATAIPWVYLSEYLRKIELPNKSRVLPDKYAVVRLFANDWLDRCPPLEVIEEYAGGLPIVVCESDEPTDNHSPFEPSFPHISFTFPPFESISNTLAAFINAELVMAPAGGLSYVSALCGKKTIAFSSRGDETYYAKNIEERLQDFGQIIRHRL
jgi:hypothetical protein